MAVIDPHQRYIVPALQASQYYIAGRYAFVCEFVPISVLLFHHAIEHAVKAEITKHTVDLDESALERLLKRTYGHDLKKLWAQLLSLHPSRGLDKFESAVEELNRFEEIRYPAPNTQYLISVSFGHQTDPPLRADAPPSNLKEMHISLGVVDELMATLWTVCDFPVAMLKGYGEPARLFVENAYYVANTHPLYQPSTEIVFMPYKPKP